MSPTPQAVGPSVAVPVQDPKSRIAEGAAARLRLAIEEAGGVEVFAIGEVDSRGICIEVDVQARGNDEAVVALVGRVRAGQVVIHNHPGGRLVASEADLVMASRYGEEGVGVVIVDNAVRKALWVVEPHARTQKPVDPAAIEAFFDEGLRRALPGCETRAPQLEMALEVGERLSKGGVLVVEAGTGTGKSLAYLVPSVLWALANERCVVVSTFTRALQDQLLGADVPLLRRSGLAFTAASMKGRANYLCRRKLEAACLEAGLDVQGRSLSGSTLDAETTTLASLAAWARGSPDGLASTIRFPVSAELWQRVESDRHQTLRARCPHFASCFYYLARRRAAASQILVVNHHLLLNDLMLKQAAEGHGILPSFDRVVVDEAHHLEAAATSVGTARLSAFAVRRALAPLLARRSARAGAIGHLVSRWGGVLSPLPEVRRQTLVNACADAERSCERMKEEAGLLLEAVAAILGMEDAPVTLDAESPHTAGAGGREEHDAAFEENLPPEAESPWVEPLTLFAERLDASARALAAVQKQLEKVRMEPAEVQPVMDLRRACDRLMLMAGQARAMLSYDSDYCRWVEPERRGQQVVLCRAPIDVASTLASILHAAMSSSVHTSATLAVGSSFDFFLARSGISTHHEVTGLCAFSTSHPSPFDFACQTLLCLPRDLPAPDQPGYEDATARLLHRMLRISGGGAFVLCTSFRQLGLLADRLEGEFGGRLRVLRQEAGGRQRLLDDFLGEQGPTALLGVDTFWEGVSVKGDALRLVVIPRLPFAVPTEPVTRARQDRMREEGLDAFRGSALPEAILRLRQGFGRLIRTRTDRGAVVILDRRLHDRWYGRLFLSALPPATRVLGPSEVVLRRMDAFFVEHFPHRPRL
jgi:ATP-dependent DNA helicase DinG